MLTTPVPKKIQISLRRMRICLGEKISAIITRIGVAKNKRTRQICMVERPAEESLRMNKLITPHKTPERRIDKIGSTREKYFFILLVHHADFFPMNICYLPFVVRLYLK